MPAPETMNDAGMPNAGAEHMDFMNKCLSGKVHVLLTAQRLSTKHDQEHGRKVPHERSFLHLWDRHILHRRLLRNMLLVQLLPNLPQSDTSTEGRGNVKGRER